MLHGQRPKVTHPELVDFNSDEEDLLADDAEDRLSYDTLANICEEQ